MSVEQDFYARVLCQNIAASLALAAQPALQEEIKGCERSYRINMKRAIGVIRDPGSILPDDDSDQGTIASAAEQNRGAAGEIRRPARPILSARHST